LGFGFGLKGEERRGGGMEVVPVPVRVLFVTRALLPLPVGGLKSGGERWQAGSSEEDGGDGKKVVWAGEKLGRELSSAICRSVIWEMWLVRDGSRELHITSKEGEMTTTETVLVGCERKIMLNKP
jgi:hypothetical protein